MKLTKREREILCLVHLPLDEIGEALGIKACTVRVHVRGIMNKFPFCINRHSCQIQALKDGVITLNDIEME